MIVPGSSDPIVAQKFLEGLKMPGLKMQKEEMEGNGEKAEMENPENGQ